MKTSGSTIRLLIVHADAAANWTQSPADQSLILPYTKTDITQQHEATLLGCYQREGVRIVVIVQTRIETSIANKLAAASNRSFALIIAYIEPPSHVANNNQPLSA